MCTSCVLACREDEKSKGRNIVDLVVGLGVNATGLFCRVFGFVPVGRDNTKMHQHT